MKLLTRTSHKKKVSVTPVEVREFAHAGVLRFSPARRLAGGGKGGAEGGREISGFTSTNVFPMTPAPTTTAVVGIYSSAEETSGQKKQ